MDTPDVIKQAALRLIDAGELEQVTVSMICAEANVSNGSFFHFFPSKGALIGSLYLDGLRSYHRRIESVIASDPDAQTGVAAAIGTHLDWVVEQRTLGALVLRDDRQSWMGTIRNERHDENLRFRSALDTWRTARVAAGEIVDVDVDMFIALIVGPAQVFCRGFLADRLPDPRERAEELVAATLRALRADE